jgi:hypothetical protein
MHSDQEGWARAAVQHEQLSKDKRKARFEGIAFTQERRKCEGGGITTRGKTKGR